MEHGLPEVTIGQCKNLLIAGADLLDEAVCGGGLGLSGIFRMGEVHGHKAINMKQ